MTLKETLKHIKRTKDIQAGYFLQNEMNNTWYQEEEEKILECIEETARHQILPALDCNDMY